MECKLEDVVLFKNGKKKPNSKGNIPIYGGNGILGYTDRYNACSNSIIIGRVGAYCGCVYKCEHECWISDNAILGQVKENNDYIYIYYLMKTLNIHDLHVGSGQPLMTQNILNNIIVDIPSYDKQVKIGKFLDRLDEKIKLNNQINDNLHDIGMNLINQYFKDIKDKVILKEIIKFVKGKKPNYIRTQKNKNLEKYLTIACLNGQELNYASTDNVIMADNDLLMVMDGASSGDIYYSDYGIVGSTLAKVEIIDTKYQKSYIYFIMKHFNELIKSKNTGSAIPHTDKVLVGSLKVPNIDTNQQNQFNCLVEKIQQLKKENEVLGQLRDVLLPKLINGEIDLDNIEI